MITLEYRKSDFSNGVNITRFKADLVGAKITGVSKACDLLSAKVLTHIILPNYSQTKPREVDFMTNLIVSVLKGMLVNLFTKKIVTEVILALLEEAAKSTETKIDDNLVRIVKEGLDSPVPKN